MINNSMDNNKDQQDNMDHTKNKADDDIGLNVSGHILIRDKDTGEELVNKRNAIHYGNMASVVAKALTGQDASFIHYMAFGNGATSVDTSGRVVYKTPRVSEAFESGANMYSRTYWKPISDTTENTDPTNNNIELINGASYTDLKCTCTLGYSEPSGQDTFDSSTTNEGEYIFDELALFTYPADVSLITEEERINTSTMLTHVLFHPVQKSANRVIEIIYTIRVQLS
jgi:hypothetical protein